MWIRLGELLLQSQLLSRQRLAQVLAHQRERGGRLGSLLLELGLLEETAVARALARQHGIPAVCLARARIDPEILGLVSPETARLHGVLPIGLEDDVLRLAIANPNDRPAVLSASKDARRRVKPCVAVGEVLKRAILRHYAGDRRAPEGEPPHLILVSEAWSPETSGDRDEVPELIPRAHFFAHPRVSDARLSPDGKSVSIISARNGRRVIEVAPLHDLSAGERIADDSEVSLEWHTWAYSGRHLLYGGDCDGDESSQVYSIERHTKLTRHLTKLTGLTRILARRMAHEARASPKTDSRLVRLSPDHPDEALVHTRMPGGRSLVYRMNLSSGQRKRVTAASICGANRYWANGDLELRLFTRYEGVNEVIWARTESEWRRVLEMPARIGERGRVVGLDASGRYVLVLDGWQENLAHLFRIHIQTGRREVIATPRYSDIESVLFGASGVDAVIEYHPRMTVRPVNKEFRSELEFLRSITTGVPIEVDGSSDGRLALIQYLADDRPPRYYLYDRAHRRTRHLFDSRPELARTTLARMTPVNVTARDGLSLPCYLTLPSWVETASTRGNQPERPLPTVICAHGGPHARDYWGFDPEVQWLANRGYAVLSVNYRGSTGFGKRLRDATPYWIAPEMLHDVVDATRWAVAEEIADPKRVAILGASYGGYLVLQGLLHHPELYACGVDLFGVADWRKLVGDDAAAPRLETDRFTARALLKARSPLYRASSIRKPLLVAHGVNDVRVPIEDSNRLTQALAASNRAVTYLLYTHEGHGFYREPNRLSYYAVVEHFLATHLGGRLENFGAALESADLRIQHGAHWIPGLEPFWQATKAIENALRRETDELDLTGYGLRELPPSIGKLRKLRKLRLARNFLTALPGEVGLLEALEVLEVQANQLMELPKELGALKRLRVLDVCGNQLRQLPVELRELPLLRRFIVGGNLFDSMMPWGFPSRVVRRSR